MANFILGYVALRIVEYFIIKLFYFFTNER